MTAVLDWRKQTHLVGTCFRVGQIVRGACGDCPEVDVLLYDAPVEETRLVCSGCVRAYPRDTRQACDKCGERGNVWRDPIPRKDVYLCVRCHDPAALFVNRWANKVRQSTPLGLRERVQCAARGYGTDCKGEVRWDSPLGKQLCNKHRGRRSANEANN